MGERTKDTIDFLSWLLCDQMIIAMGKTIFMRNPCKTKKCLVRASCTEVCNLKKDYLNLCDCDGRIGFQRAVAISVYFSLSMIVWSLVTAIFK